MNKFLAVAVLCTVAMAVSVADARIKISTSAFSITHTTITTGGRPLSIIAVRFTTGSVFDFVDVFDSSTTVNSAGAPTYRFYNDNVVSTSAVTTLGSGVSKGSTIIPLYRGGIFRPSSAEYNGIEVIYDDNRP